MNIYKIIVKFSELRNSRNTLNRISSNYYASRHFKEAGLIRNLIRIYLINTISQEYNL